jgi:hypothetical protein
MSSCLESLTSQKPAEASATANTGYTPAEALAAILEAVRWTPSRSETQYREIVAVRDPVVTAVIS